MIEREDVIGKVVGGYTVIEIAVIPDNCTDLDGHCIALGVHKFSDNLVMYATWEYNEVGGFYWGHYDMTEPAGYADLYRRALKICI